MACSTYTECEIISKQYPRFEANCFVIIILVDPMIIRTHAYPRVGLIGNPSDVYFGKINGSLMPGVGSALDFHSGNRKWAPSSIRKLGLE